jgi:tetratricopeptide (TPR) repeat protein
MRLTLPLLLLLTGCSAALTATTPRATTRTGDACIQRSARTFGALAQRTSALEQLPRPGLSERCELALLYVTAGRFAEGEALVREIMRTDPHDVGANLLLARALDRSARPDSADALVRRLEQLAPGHTAVRVLHASRADPEQAGALWRAILADEPASIDALAGVAADHLRLEHHDSARALLDRALLADSLHAGAHRAMSRLLRAEGDRERAFRHTLAVVRLDPYDAAAHASLATGGSYLSWGRYPPLHDDSVPPDLARRLDAADALLLAGELDRAEAAFRDVLAVHPRLAAALVGIGAVHYYREQFEDAARVFREIAHAHPGFGLAHYGFTQSERRRRERDDPDVRAAIERFRGLPRPPEPDRLREVFVDFDRLDDDHQKIVLLSVAPLGNYIPILAIAGATVQLLPFHKRLWELPNKERTRARRTFDLRLWDDVKGQGGFHAVAGEEWMRDVMLERFNVLAHEFMHQVHSFFTEEQRKEVESLFRVAKREKRTLDSYADYNEMEYLAQAYEAYISPAKAEGLGGTAGHTRASVTAKDPRIVAFLERVNARESYRENEIIAHRQKTRNLVTEGKLAEAEAAARAALDHYGEHPDLLSALTGALRIRGDYDAAIAADTRSTTLFPDRVRGFLDLAEDHVLGRHDHTAAAQIVASYLARDSASDEAWLARAGHEAAAGDVAGATASLARAAVLLGEPIAEADYFSTAATIALLRGDRAAAIDAYRHSIENISRSSIPGWTEQAWLALDEGDLERAATLLGTARAIDRESPAVAEMEARLAAAEGNRRDAIERLTALYERDPRRLETVTALIAVIGPDDPGLAPSYVTAGRRLIELREPVSHVYERDRWVPRGRLDALAIARFEAAVSRSTR